MKISSLHWNAAERVRRNYGGKPPVSIKCHNLFSFKEGVVQRGGSEYLWNEANITFIWFSSVYSSFKTPTREIAIKSFFLQHNRCIHLHTKSLHLKTSHPIKNLKSNAFTQTGAWNWNSVVFPCHWCIVLDIDLKTNINITRFSIYNIIYSESFSPVSKPFT